ncbi:hypothetical protein BB561_001534 [Smittium simulii]|uniref:F-box domain-containing protein n=1 Tax=Smittium simulii TaxID=133385 RepID=A0A2T9YUD4_9FUNG|nr:hypothetical protein BB561_001534 [Smittium simulii]
MSKPTDTLLLVLLKVCKYLDKNTKLELLVVYSRFMTILVPRLYTEIRLCSSHSNHIYILNRLLSTTRPSLSFKLTGNYALFLKTKNSSVTVINLCDLTSNIYSKVPDTWLLLFLLAYPNLKKLVIKNCDFLDSDSINKIVKYCNMSVPLASTQIEYLAILDKINFSNTINLPRLVHLDISNCDSLSSKDLATIFSILPNLNVIIAQNLTFLADHTLDLISKKNPNLTTLDISKCPNVSSYALINLLKHNTCIRNLRLFGCNAVNNKLVSKLYEYTQLKVLDISACSKVTAEGFNKMYGQIENHDFNCDGYYQPSLNLTGLIIHSCNNLLPENRQNWLAVLSKSAQNLKYLSVSCNNIFTKSKTCNLGFIVDIWSHFMSLETLDIRSIDRDLFLDDLVQIAFSAPRLKLVKLQAIIDLISRNCNDDDYTFSQPLSTSTFTKNLEFEYDSDASFGPDIQIKKVPINTLSVAKLNKICADMNISTKFDLESIDSISY